MGEQDTIKPILQLASMIKGERESTRIPIHAKARILTNGETIEGEVENLSMNGAYVKSEKQVKVNSSVVVTIFDDSAKLRTIFDIKAKVVWVVGNGVGLQFA